LNPEEPDWRRAINRIDANRKKMAELKEIKY